MQAAELTDGLTAWQRDGMTDWCLDKQTDRHSESKWVHRSQPFCSIYQNAWRLDISICVPHTLTLTTCSSISTNCSYISSCSAATSPFRLHDSPSICLPAAAAAAALSATLASGDAERAVVFPNCGKPAAVDIYADASGFGSDPVQERERGRREEEKESEK